MACKHLSHALDSVFAWVHSCPNGQKQLPESQPGASGTGSISCGGFYYLPGLDTPGLQGPLSPLPGLKCPGLTGQPGVGLPREGGSIWPPPLLNGQIRSPPSPPVIPGPQLANQRGWGQCIFTGQVRVGFEPELPPC